MCVNCDRALGGWVEAWLGEVCAWEALLLFGSELCLSLLEGDLSKESALGGVVVLLKSVPCVFSKAVNDGGDFFFLLGGPSDFADWGEEGDEGGKKGWDSVEIISGGLGDGLNDVGGAVPLLSDCR